MKSNIDRCWTASHRPTPPACGHTRTPNFAASRRMAMFSFTPATRAASIWSTSMAPACSSCLNITRFCTCSPVATGMGATPRAMAACPRMSSGLVGSSIQAMPYGARCDIHSMASCTSHRWLASTAILMSGPTASRAARTRRMSSWSDAPTLSLIWVKPSATASFARRASFWSL